MQSARPFALIVGLAAMLALTVGPACSSTSSSAGSGQGGAAGSAGGGSAGGTGGGGGQGTNSGGSGAGGTGGDGVGGTAARGNFGGSGVGGGTGSGGIVGSGGRSVGGAAGGAGTTAGATGGRGGSGGSTGSGGAAGGTAGGNAGGVVGSGGAAGSSGVGGSGGGGGGTSVGAWPTCRDLTSAKLTSEYTAWNKAYVVACGTDKARVHKGSSTSVSNTTVSEGIGYGMWIAAGMRDCDLLKKLHRFYLGAQNFTNNPANAAAMKGNGLMPWSLSSGCDTNTVDDANFATDGDLDSAMGLLQGSAVCSDQGTYDYKAGAVTIINALKKNAFMTSNGKTILKSGGLGTSINPSYFALGYFRAFAKAIPADASFWQQAVTDQYALLASYQSKMSGNDAGKFPDWGNADGTPSGNFGWEACRVPWRIATDYAWSSEANAKTLLATFRTTGMGGKLPYAAATANPGDYHNNSAFVGAMVLSAIGADQATMDSFCGDWLKRTTTSGGELDDSDYYKGTLRLVYMMLASGMATSTL